MEIEKFNGNKDKDKAPSTACLFEMPNEIIFAEQNKEKDFSIVGYSGGIIKNHWYWGNVAFDLKGITFAKKRTPVLEEHFTSSRIGFATKQEITDKVSIDGKFLTNDNARQMSQDLKDGFPMEASLYIPPSVIEYVKDGAETEVNGQILKGPGAVFRKSVIKEVSMCVFGADENTQSSTYDVNVKSEISFNLLKGNTMKDKDEKLTLEQFKADNAELFDEVFAAGKAEGEKAERDIFAELQKVCRDDNALLVECYSQGKTVNEALQMRAEKAEAENKKLSEQLASKTAQNLDPNKKKIEAARQEFSDIAVEPGKEPGKFDDSNATDDELREHFKKTKELQDIYSSADAYIADIRHS